MLNTLEYDIYTSDIMIMIQADIPLSKTTGSREKSVLNTIEFTFINSDKSQSFSLLTFTA